MMNEQELVRKALESVSVCDHELIDNWAEWTGTMGCKHCNLLLDKGDTKVFKAEYARLLKENEADDN